jgi:hypothetical protein
MKETAAAEVWSFLETERNAGRLHGSAVPMAAEAQRLGRRLERKPCGVVIGRSGDPLALRTSVYGNRVHRRMMVPDDRPWVFSIYPPSPQAHRLDTGFYDKFFKPGSYLSTHKRNVERWLKKVQANA